MTQQNELQDFIQHFEALASQWEANNRLLQKKIEMLNVELEAKNAALENSLKKTEELRSYLNCIIESAQNGIVVIDMDGIVKTFNQAAEKMTGFDRNHIIGQPYPKFLDENPPLFYLQQENYFPEKKISKKDGQHLSVGFKIAYLMDDEQTPIGAVETFWDLTEIKKMETEVQRNKTLAALGEMAATVAHEIRNPLGGIEGFASLLLRELEDDWQKDLAESMISGVHTLNRIVSSLLAYTRPVHLQIQEINLMEVVWEALQFAQLHQIGEQTVFHPDIELDYPTASAEYPIFCDAQQLRQVILNLLINAAQAIPKKGTVSISICSQLPAKPFQVVLPHESEKTHFFLLISDNGTGISEENAAKLFHPFFTLKEKGTGLGLPICKKILESHQYGLGFYSQISEGTCFYIAALGKENYT